ncbi:MAG: SDR family NAD(P)-dependent oxidoreductase [Myxococcota bacterium]
MNHPAIAEAKVAVITGGASGIGLAAAMALSKRGMRICLADLEQTALERATKLVGGEPGRHHPQSSRPVALAP